MIISWSWPVDTLGSLSVCDRLPYASVLGAVAVAAQWLMSEEPWLKSSTIGSWDYRHLLTGSCFCHFWSHFQLSVSVAFYQSFPLLPFTHPSDISSRLLDHLSVFRFFCSFFYFQVPVVGHRKSDTVTSVVPSGLPYFKSLLDQWPIPIRRQNERRTRPYSW